MDAQTSRLVLRGHSGFALRHTIAFRFEMYWEGLAVGIAGLSPAAPKIVLDYKVWQPYQRRGFATQAVGLVCHWAFDEVQLTRIVAKVNKENLASQKVLGRCGFAVYDCTAKLYYCDKYRPKTAAR